MRPAAPKISATIAASAGRARFGLALLLGACFRGESVQGLPCTTDAACGPSFTCVDGLCGGPGGPALCGNGLVEEGEGCDDGNTIDGDGCSAKCDHCGDGILQAWEECDDGNVAADDLCTPLCRLPVCGDGFVAAGEACDDGDDVGNDGCTPACRLPTCGDGLVTAGEACDDGNADDTDACTTACTFSPEPPTLALTLAQVKQFTFTWAPALGATHYQLLERSAPGEDFTQLGDDLVGASLSQTVPLHLRADAGYLLRACNQARCVDSAPVDVVGTLVDAVGYFKASNTDAGDKFGASVALSDDGSTLAVGAPWEASGASGIDGDEGDNSLPLAGAVYVFTRQGAGWSQEAYVKPESPAAGRLFGAGVALSGDGDALVVLEGQGAAHLFARDPRTHAWTEEQSFLVNASAAAISSDAGTLAFGVRGDSSSAVGIGGDPSDTGAPGSGAVRVYVQGGDGEGWGEEAYIKASNTGQGDAFGHRVALSADGDTLAVSAFLERSAAEGIDGDQDNDDAYGSGAVYVFTRVDALWSQQAYVKASNTGMNDAFGASLALARDGATLAVGATGEDSASTGVDGGDGDDFPPAIPQLAQSGAGAAYVFLRRGDHWSQEAYVKASNTGDFDLFGGSVALSHDGGVLAVGAVGEDSLATGVGGPQDDLFPSGAVYVFTRAGRSWSERAFVKAPQPIPEFGGAVVLTGDGETLAVGAAREASAAAGIGGEQVDDSRPDAGAVYLY